MSSKNFQGKYSLINNTVYIKIDERKIFVFFFFFHKSFGTFYQAYKEKTFEEKAQSAVWIPVQLGSSGSHCAI